MRPAHSRTSSSPRAPWLRAARARGQGLVEYSMLLLLIMVVVVAGVTLLGRDTGSRYSRIDCSVGQAMRDATACPVTGNPGSPSDPDNPDDGG